MDDHSNYYEEKGRAAYERLRSWASYIVNPLGAPGERPGYILGLVVVNFAMLFVHFLKSVHNKPMSVVSSRFLVYAFILATPALLSPIIFFAGFVSVLAYQNFSSQNIYLF